MSDDARYSDDDVEVEGGTDSAVLLLDAVEKAKLDPSVVRAQSGGTFIVPKDLADKAGVKPVTDGTEDEPATPRRRGTTKKDGE